MNLGPLAWQRRQGTRGTISFGGAFSLRASGANSLGLAESEKFFGVGAADFVKVFFAQGLAENVDGITLEVLMKKRPIGSEEYAITADSGLRLANVG